MIRFRRPKIFSHANATYAFAMLGLLCGAAGCSDPEEAPQAPAAAVPANPALDESEPPAQPPEPDEVDVEYPDAESTNGEFVDLKFDDFAAFPPDGATSWSVTDEVWKTSGQPRAYFASTHSYGDFTLRYEYRFPAASGDDKGERTENTGCLVYIDHADKIWPVCLEVQGKYPETGMIKVNGRKDLAVDVEEFPDVRQQALNPPDQWNQIEIVSEGGALTVHLNGELISRSQPTELRSGRIAFQAENHEVEFRGLQIRVP